MKRVRITIPNPGAGRGAVRPASLITDRAKRYRAQRAAPPEPRICHYCGSRSNVEVEHVDGFEENLEPENLTWACRACNTRKGIHFRNSHAGRRTRQYNPRDSFSTAAAGLAGRRAGLRAKESRRVPFGVFEEWRDRHLQGLAEEPTATEVQDWRRAFYAGYRQRSNPQGARNLYQWLDAVLTLKGEGGSMKLADAIAMVHATPHAKRSEFAGQIWRQRRARGTDRWSRRDAEEVPF